MNKYILYNVTIILIPNLCHVNWRKKFPTPICQYVIPLFILFPDKIIIRFTLELELRNEIPVGMKTSRQTIHSEYFSLIKFY